MCKRLLKNLVGGGFRKSMYKAKMRCVALLIIMLSMVSCGQNRPEQNDTEQNTSEVTEEMTPNTITTTAVSNEETEPVDLLEDFSLENLKGKTDPEVIRQELSVLPLNIDELKDYPVYVLDWQSRECSGAELLDEFYEQTSENQPAQLVIVHHLVSEELVTASQLWSLSYIEFDGTDYFMFENDSEDGTWKDDCSEMYFHSLNIIRRQPEQSEIELIMIVFTDQEDVSDEEAEQYVQLLYDVKRPENVEVRPFLNLRKTS